MQFKQLALGGALAALLMAPAVAAPPISQYTLQLSAAEMQVLLRGVKKLTIEEGADLLNDIVRQATMQEDAAAKAAAPKPPEKPNAKH